MDFINGLTNVFFFFNAKRNKDKLFWEKEKNKINEKRRKRRQLIDPDISEIYSNQTRQYFILNAF